MNKRQMKKFTKRLLYKKYSSGLDRPGVRIITPRFGNGWRYRIDTLDPIAKLQLSTAYGVFGTSTHQFIDHTDKSSIYPVRMIHTTLPSGILGNIKI